MLNNGTQVNATDSSHELSKLGVVAAAEAIRKGEITSERYATSLLHLARARAELNSFVTIDETAVLQAAREADNRRAAGVTAPLLGVPVGIKDSYLTSGLKTTFGLDDFEFVPDEDASTILAIKEAGGIVFGKNNLVSMSYGLTGKDSRAGQVKNPRDPSRVSGGSSSGAGAAVGAGIVPASLGGDTVGSIRVPASLSGVVGFKPTTGRWPGRGVAPISHTLDTTGVLARSARDCALIDRVISGAAAGRKPNIETLKGIRFASAPRQFLDLVDPEVHARFDELVRRLRSEGAEVVEVDLGDDFVAITRSATWGIFAHETMGAVKRFLADHKIPLTFDEVLGHLSPFLRGAWEHIVLPTGAGYVSPRAYEVAVSTQRIEVQHRFHSAFRARGLDAFLLPTTPCTAPLIEHQLRFSIAGQEVEYLALANNTVSASLAGLPGISVPAGLSSEGLPLGLELDGQTGDDARLLEIASLVEGVVAGTPG